MDISCEWPSGKYPILFGDKGDTVEIREKSRSIHELGGALEAVKRREIPPMAWVASATMKSRVRIYQVVMILPLPMQERLVVELYSK